MIDTHCHLHGKEFDIDRLEVLDRMEEKRMKGITIGTSIEDSQKAVALASAYPDVLRCTIGVHPDDALSVDLSIVRQELYSLSQRPFVVGVGECGYDFYYQDGDDVRKAQNELFHLHIEVARFINKPLVIHTRNSFQETREALSKYEGLSVVLHCFTGDETEVEAFCKLPHTFYFSLAGMITFARGVETLQEVVPHIPKDRLLLETDSPYLAPVPYRGKRNEPVWVEETGIKVSELLGISTQSLWEQVMQNSSRVFDW